MHKEFTEQERQDFAKKLWEREVIQNASFLVDYLFRAGAIICDDVINEYDENECSKEIFEWYQLTEWLTKKLEAKGEVVMYTDFGDFWGRTTCGQLVFLDEVLQAIAIEVYK